MAERDTFAHLLEHCLTVWVTATPNAHMQRVIAQGDLRPMRDNRRSMDDLRAILASREALYALADLRIDTTNRAVPETVDALATALNDFRHPDSD